MKTKPRYLTKSRFKLGLECPTKLFYTGKKEYPNSKMDDPFLEALAEGGYQVGELAKCYFSNGHNIESLDYEEAEAKTNELLKHDKVIIFEPAIRFQNLFIRIDILVKNGSKLDLIEVKAKSYDPREGEQFLNKNGTISSEWLSYLYDIAFQRHVLSSAFPRTEINSYLMMSNKAVACPVDGLNQKFRITRDSNNRKGVKVSNSLTSEDLSNKILIQVPVEEYIKQIYEGKETKEAKVRNFFEEIDFLATIYEKDQRIEAEIGSHCKVSNFRHCVPPDFHHSVPLNFHQSVPPDFLGTCTT